jgi:hypothetical protein
MSIPTTRERVPAHTADHVNRQIEQTIEDNVGQHGVSPETIARRLSELDAEWDIERAIEANASALAFIGVALGYFVHPNWLALPALVTAFLFQHAVQGWCPPIPMLRRLGFRTVHEIEQERQALKAIRGDYQDLQGARDRVSTVLAAVKR